MAKASHRIILELAIALVILANASAAMAANCNPKIDDSHYAISYSMKMASSIQYGVTGLAADNSGDHPTHPLVIALQKFRAAAAAFVNANKKDVAPGHYEFNAADCPPPPSDSLSKDDCDYCPKYKNPKKNCDPKYAKVLRADVYALTYGRSNSPPPIKGKFEAIPIKLGEGVSCIAIDLDKVAPKSEEAITAENLAYALDVVLGAADGPAYLWGIKVLP